MASLLAPLVLAGALLGDGPFNFNDVTPIPANGDQNVPDIWTLKLSYRAPRYVMVDIPGKGRRLVWYMRYYVINDTGKDRLVIPKFTIVTKDGQKFEDEVIPSAQRAVLAREDPTQQLHNSITISSKPIPFTPAEGKPIEVHGIVFWDGGEELMKAKSFEIFVTGLSNGYVKTEPAEGEEESPMLRKTLRLPFAKPGDLFNPDDREIRTAGSPAWIYR